MGPHPGCPISRQRAALSYEGSDGSLQLGEVSCQASAFFREIGGSACVEKAPALARLEGGSADQLYLHWLLQAPQPVRGADRAGHYFPDDGARDVAAPSRCNWLLE